jgi:hypothetical protein
MKKRRKQRLTAANKAKRVQYAKDMTGYDWSKVLWTDETVFYLGSVQTKGWQDPEHPEEIELTRFPPKINVWGGIGYYFKTKLFFTTENINSARYIKILKARLPPNYVADCPRRCRGDWIFMQDGATAHTSKASVAYLDRVAPDRLRNHPPQSPDFNPIENVWSYLDREIRKHKNVKDIDDLKKRLRRIWNKMPIDVIRVPVASMTKRLKQCLALQGRRTSY